MTEPEEVEVQQQVGIHGGQHASSVAGEPEIIEIEQEVGKHGGQTTLGHEVP